MDTCARRLGGWIHGTTCTSFQKTWRSSRKGGHEQDERHFSLALRTMPPFGCATHMREGRGRKHLLLPGGSQFLDAGIERHRTLVVGLVPLLCAAGLSRPVITSGAAVTCEIRQPLRKTPTAPTGKHEAKKGTAPGLGNPYARETDARLT